MMKGRKAQISMACQTETQGPTQSWILFVLELQRYKPPSWSGQRRNWEICACFTVDTGSGVARCGVLVCTWTQTGSVCHYLCLILGAAGGLHTPILSFPFPGHAEGLPLQTAADWVENHVSDWHHAARSICKSPSWQQTLGCCSRSPLKCLSRGHTNTIC